MKKKSDSLTERQTMVHYEICRFFRANNRFPSHRELVEALSLENSSIIHSIKRLRELEFIQKIPKRHGYRILRWVDESVRVRIPITGFLVKDKVISSRRDPIGFACLTSASVAWDEADLSELFALRVIQTGTAVRDRCRDNDILIFRRRCAPTTGNSILASLNGIRKLFKIKISMKEILLLPEGDSPIHLGPQDELVVDGIMMSSFRNAEIEAI